MKLDKRKKIIIISCVGVLILLICCLVVFKSSDSFSNNNSKLESDKDFYDESGIEKKLDGKSYKYKDFVIDSMYVKKLNGFTRFSFYIESTSASSFNDLKFNIVFLKNEDVKCNNQFDIKDIKSKEGKYVSFDVENDCYDVNNFKFTYK